VLRALHREVWGQTAYDAAYPANAPRSTGPQATRLAGFGAIGLGVLFALFGLAPSVANATPPNPEHKVTLCHATDGYSNPYVRITVDVASVLHHGHDGHNGPVFYPAIPKHTKWGDIIPPFDFGPGETYGGKNWDATGIAVFDNGCVIPSAPTTTTTASSAPTTTTTVVVVTSTTPSTTVPPPPGGSTTTTSSVPETTSSSAVTTSTTTIPTATTAGATTTVAGETSTTLVSDAVATLGGSSTTVAGTNAAPLPFTGGNSTPSIVAGLVLIAAGFGLTRRRPPRP
jgi:hypothetical protein